MTNGLGLLREAAKGHPGVGSGGVELTFPWNNSGANGDFKGTDPNSVFTGDWSAITVLHNQISSFSEIFVPLIN